MSKYITALLLLVCLVAYGSSLKCHTCTSQSSSGCIYGTTQNYDMKDCASGQDRCFRVTTRKGDRWAPNEYERGCSNQDYCTEERSKQNSEYDVGRCELCDYDGCNSGSLNY